jgi:hypothetical protein
LVCDKILGESLDTYSVRRNSLRKRKSKRKRKKRKLKRRGRVSYTDSIISRKSTHCFVCFPSVLAFLLCALFLEHKLHAGQEPCSIESCNGGLAPHHYCRKRMDHSIKNY